MNVQAVRPGAVVHRGRPSHIPGMVVIACDGRTMNGTPTQAPVTCKRKRCADR